MKTFNVFSNKDGDYKAVKDGWSWPAFIFGPFWALYNKMWKIAFLFLLVFFASMILLSLISSEYVGGRVVDTIGIIISLVFGYKGNKWKESLLLKNGYEFIKSTTWASAEKAIESVKDNEKADKES